MQKPIFLSNEQINQIFNGALFLDEVQESASSRDIRIQSFKDVSFGISNKNANNDLSLNISQISETNNSSKLMDSTFFKKLDQEGSPIININNQLVMMTKEECQKMHDNYSKCEEFEQIMKGFEDSDLKQLKERITKLLKENHDLRISTKQTDEDLKKLQSSWQFQRKRNDELLVDNQQFHNDRLKSEISLKEIQTQYSQANSMKTTQNRLQSQFVNCEEQKKVIELKKKQIEEQQKQISDLQEALQKARLETSDSHQHSVNSHTHDEPVTLKQINGSPTNVFGQPKTRQQQLFNKISHSQSQLVYNKNNDLLNIIPAPFNTFQNKTYYYDSRINYQQGIMSYKPR